VIIGGDRGDGGVIDQSVGVTGTRWTGVDIAGGGDAAATQGGLSDDQDAARWLQHDYLSHPRRAIPCRSVLVECERVHSLLVCSSTMTTATAATLSVSFSSTTRSPALKAPTRPLPSAPPVRTNTSRLILKLSF